jgi:hypothetical protein
VLKEGDVEERFENIDSFVRRVRERLNRHLGLDILIRSLCAAGGMLFVLGLGYILRGHRVPLFWYPAVLALAVMAGSAWWVIRRRSFYDAAAYADRHFQLKDAVRSYEGFSRAHKHGGVYELQAEHTHAALEHVRATDVKYRWPARTAAICVGLLFSSALMTLKADNPKISEAHRRDEQILAETEQINEQIKETLEQIKEDAQAEDIEKLIAPDRLEKMVDELRETSDLKDAMRQYAKLEKRLNTVLSKLQQRQDEQMYKRMGEALQDSDQAKALGKQLAKRQFKEAAQELEKHKSDETSSSEDQRRQLEKLKSISQRMASEAERSRSSCKAADLAKRLDKAASTAGEALKSSSNGSGQQGSTSSQQGSQSSGTQGSSSQGSSSEGSGSSGVGAPGSGSGGPGSEGVNECLDQMAENLNDLDAKCKAQSAIQKLCKALSQSQGRLCDQSAKGDGSGNGKCDGGGGSGDGGLEPGTGSSSNTNANVNDAPSTGDNSVLKGMKGQGPSINTTEAASDGSGSRSGPNARLIQQYRRQAESFIRREDVPEVVKSGVKQYFESIHQSEEGN